MPCSMEFGDWAAAAACICSRGALRPKPMTACTTPARKIIPVPKTVDIPASIMMGMRPSLKNESIYNNQVKIQSKQVELGSFLGMHMGTILIYD